MKKKQLTQPGIFKEFCEIYNQFYRYQSHNSKEETYIHSITGWIYTASLFERPLGDNIIREAWFQNKNKIREYNKFLY